MTLRARVTVAAGGAVLFAVVAVSVSVYVVVRANLRDQIDDSLRTHGAQQYHNLRPPATAAGHVPLVEDVFVQVVDDAGAIVAAFDDRPLPITPQVLAVARGERDDVWFDADVGGQPVRILATPQDGFVIEIGRSLKEVDETLRQLLVALFVISTAAVGIAALVGRLVAAAAAAPVHRVARAAEAVARTGELSHHIEVPGGDDLGRLAVSFNTMLDALSQSLGKQRQLVADASHELRTPLATVRTNIEVLARGDELPSVERDALIRDTVAQIGELTRLVEDLVELARGDGHDEPFATVDLLDLTRICVDVAGRNHPSITFQLDGDRSVIRGATGRVSKAVSNLIDNAAKWSPPGAAVEVGVGEGTVMVRDHGPGIDRDDLPHIFDRFYRAAGARTMPGSGLGLAIVSQVAEIHRGTVTVSTAPGGGAVFVLRFPVLRSADVSTVEVPTELSPPS